MYKKNIAQDNNNNNDKKQMKKTDKLFPIIIQRFFF